MKRLLIILASIIAASSCIINVNLNKVVGNGNIVEKTYEFDSFDAIRVAGAMDVVYIQEDVKPVAVFRVDENLFDEYTLEVEEGTLVISSKPGSLPIPTKGAKVTVTAPVIKSVKLTGSGDCSIPNGFTSEGDFSYSVAGSGDLHAYSINCRNFDSRVSGSGDIEIGSLVAEGSANMVISGSGDIELEAATCESLGITISGSGSADIGCRGAGDINVRISGSGSISLAGTARSLSKSVSGSGSVNAHHLTLSD